MNVMWLKDRLLSRFHSKALPADFFCGVVDVHSHILPGVDDGIKTMDEACEALHAFEELNMSGAILTPHFMADYGENRRPAIEHQFAELTKRWEKETGGLRIQLAAEYMGDDRFLSHLPDGLLTLDKKTGFVLVETSYLASHPDFDSMLYEVALEGYRPVIAHPERYTYATDHTYASWRRRGYRFQLNLLSLAGAYGDMAQDKALNLLEKGMYTYVGSDLHHLDVWKRYVGDLTLTSQQTDAVHALYENNAGLMG